MPLNQIDSRSRSAGSPALPTAMTTRPQLASSPAIAVLTSGELAIDSAMRRAEFFDPRALDDDLDQLARAFAVARHLLGEIGEHGIKALAKGREPRIGRARDLGDAARRGGAGGEGQQRVGGRGVAVDGHGVESVLDALAAAACAEPPARSARR